MKTLKNVMIVGIAVIGACVLTACMTDETTGETVFVGKEILAKAATAIQSIPDESKATALEGLAWLLGATGVGAAAVPALKAGAGYFRERWKKKNAELAETSTETQTDADGGNGANV